MRTKSLRRLPGAAPVGRSSGSTPGQIIAPVCAWLIAENGLTCDTESCVFKPSSYVRVAPGRIAPGFFVPGAKRSGICAALRKGRQAMR